MAFTAVSSDPTMHRSCLRNAPDGIFIDFIEQKKQFAAFLQNYIEGRFAVVPEGICILVRQAGLLREELKKKFDPLKRLNTGGYVIGTRNNRPRLPRGDPAVSNWIFVENFCGDNYKEGVFSTTSISCFGSSTCQIRVLMKCRQLILKI